MNKILKIFIIVLFFGFADYGFKYPIFHWIIFYFYANTILYLTTKSYMYSKKLTSVDIANLIFISVFLFYLAIYKSDGWLIYPCVFTILSIIIAIVIALKQNKGNDNE